MNLYDSDREILLNPTGWLNDTIMNAAQEMLKKQFPNLSGLQDVALGLVVNFRIPGREFLQILHSPINHWVTVSTIDVQNPNTIKLFDSKFAAVTTSLKTQIAALLCTNNETIQVNVVDSHSQVKYKFCYSSFNILCTQMGSCDCGLFAIAYAVAVAFGKDPEVCIFNQEMMRKHLFHCFTEGILTPFPGRASNSATNTLGESIDVHCYCRMPEFKDIPMIECTNCLKWFHYVCCENVSEECMDSSDIEWFCCNCL